MTARYITPVILLLPLLAFSVLVASLWHAANATPVQLDARIALNTLSSSYAPGIPLPFYASIVDEAGGPVCHAEMVLQAMGDGNVLFSAVQHLPCEPGTSSVAAYFFAATFPAVGNYTLVVSAASPTAAGRANFSAHIGQQRLSVTRTSNSSVFPPQAQRMQLSVVSSVAAGPLTEHIPAGFSVRNTDAVVSHRNNEVLLVWNRTLLPGVPATLTYEFIAPQDAPGLYHLGPLQAGSLAEGRTWTLATHTAPLPP